MSPALFTSITLVSVGIAFLLGALHPIRKILSNPNSSRAWFFLAALVVFFVLGYVVFLLAIWAGPRTPLELVIATILSAGGLFVLLVAFLTSASLEAQANLTRAAEYRALHDELTGLPNRRFLMERLHELIAHCDPRQTLSLHIIDFDRFKDINDSLGHAAGDRLLQHYANVLRDSIREGDIVARLSGDEFAVVLPKTRPAEAVAQARLLHQGLACPVQIDEHTVVTNCSFGLACAPDHAGDPSALLRCADSAMYTSKREQNLVTLYEEGMEASARERLWGASALKQGLYNGDFSLVYQPIRYLETKEFRDVEVLVRWNSEVHGNISPEGFIPLSEKLGLVRSITDELLRLVIAEYPFWSKQGVTLWLNLSAHDLVDPNLTERLMTRLTDAGVPLESIGVEITETALLVSQDEAIKNATKLAAAGVRLAIDDFGTGYSTLSHLSQLPVSEIKIDKTFIHGLTQDQTSFKIIKACVDMAQGLSITVVAEGVETESELQALTALGCDKVQGFLFDRPAPLTDLHRLSRSTALPN